MINEPNRYKHTRVKPIEERNVQLPLPRELRLDSYTRKLTPRTPLGAAPPDPGSDATKKTTDG